MSAVETRLVKWMSGGAALASEQEFAKAFG